MRRFGGPFGKGFAAAERLETLGVAALGGADPRPDALPAGPAESGRASQPAAELRGGTRAEGAALAAATTLIAEREGNDSLATAQILDRSAFVVADNPKLRDPSLPSLTIKGAISDFADRDYFTVYLEKGDHLHLDIRTWKGADWGAYSLGRFFSIYDTLGRDDGGPGSAFIMFVAHESGNYSFSIQAPTTEFPEEYPSSTGAYTAYVSIGRALDPKVTAAWDASRWEHTNLTYSFPTSASDYAGSNDGNGFPYADFGAFNDSQQAAVVDVYAGLSSFTNLTFTEVAGGGGTLRFAMNSNMTVAGGPSYVDHAGGDSYYQYALNFDNLRPGFHTYFVLMHEIGHSLGLKHGHEEGHAYPPLPPENDSLEFSLMTYRDYVGGPIGGYSPEDYPQTFMMYDIATLQFLYGADFTTNAGDTVYRWSPTTGQMSINGVGQALPNGNRVFMTIWDGGGNDTYDLSDYAGGVAVDLRPAGWTTTSAAQLARLQPDTFDSDPVYARGNVANAFLYRGDTRSLIENAVGGAGADELTGNQGANRLDGGAGNDRLDGGEANDLLDGGLGDDRLTGGAGFDTATYASVASGVSVSLALTAAQNTGAAGSDTLAGIEALIGSAFGDSLAGDSAANRLDGGAGADTLAGGLGDDVFVVDNAGDKVIEAAGAGVDRVEASIGYTLAANVENLTLTGSAAIAGTGNDLANLIVGNLAANALNGGASSDILDGAGGADTMRGGSGNDVYIVDNAGDKALETASGDGVDKVKSSVSYTLGAFVEELVLTGSAAIGGTGNGLANAITGNSAANALAGGDGDDSLDGRSGADTMTGGNGDDRYFVDNAADKTVEQSGGGFDTVTSTISLTLGANIEKLVLAAGALNGTGNALANVLAGNGGANRLDGKAGADTMTGWGGNDLYVVDHVGDKVVEAAGGGTDTVTSSVSFTLAANVENLALAGSAVGGTGNGLANLIGGTSAANVLNGAGGADRMTGWAGNDIYWVDHVGDKVVESSAAGGIDTVNSKVGFTLGAYVEKLTLTGSAAVNGTGNGLANTLTGNAAANTLKGSGGDDTIAGAGGNDRIHGGLGKDKLSGGTGDDGFYFDTALGSGNVDSILDFVVSDDTIHLSRSIFTKAGAAGALTPGAFRTGTAAGDPGDRIVYDAATGHIYYDPDGSGAAAQIHFATIGANKPLTSADFLIYG